MGWLQKAVKAIKTTTKDNVSAFKKKGIKSLSLRRVSASNLLQEAGGYGLSGQRGTMAEVAAKKAAAAAAAKAEEDKSAADMQAIKDEAAKQLAMPTIDSAAVEAARKKAAMLAAARGGRASTMLSDTGQ